MKRPLLATLCFSAVGLLAARAADLSDETIRKSLIGSWIVPRESSDWSNLDEGMIETFRADGTYSVTSHAPDDCQKVLRNIEAKWSVQNGILTSVYSNGGRSKDQILDIRDGRMTLRSLEDGSSYLRKAADECGKPMS